MRIHEFGVPARHVAQGQLLQMLGSVRGVEDGSGAYGDVGRVLDLLDEIVRHRGGERRAPHEEGHGLGAPGQVQGGLSRRIRAADDVHVVPLAGARLGQRGTVEHPAPRESREAWGVELPVRHSGREDHAVRGDGGAVGEQHGARGSVHLQARHLTRGEDLGAEPRGLAPGAFGELGPGHAVREAEVVLDP